MSNATVTIKVREAVGKPRTIDSKAVMSRSREPLGDPSGEGLGFVPSEASLLIPAPVLSRTRIKG